MELVDASNLCLRTGLSWFWCYKLYITCTLTGFLFDLDQSKVCKDIQKIERLIRRCLPIPQKLYIWFRLDSNRSLHHSLSLDLPYNKRVIKACRLSIPYLPSRQTFERRSKTISTDIKEKISTKEGKIKVLVDLVKFITLY